MEAAPWGNQRHNHAEVLKGIDEKPDYNDVVVKSLADLITEFKSTQTD